ncbi:MAG: M20/M25/M40 family metallo-hydrolase, partial [Gemmatimonadales bacterium]
MHDADSLLTNARVRAACSHIELNDERTVARQSALSAIPAPTGAEGKRAARVAEMFRDVRLEEVAIDEVGNVQGWYVGARHAVLHDGCVVLSAHLDTVFGPEHDVTVRRRGRRLEGPGIADNARGLAALIAVADAWRRAEIRSARPVLFAATVGEEGHGDLRGVKHLFGDHGVGARHAVP